MPWKGITGAVIAVVVCLIASRIIVDFMVDWIWFSALGYWDVFWTVFRTRTWMFLVVLVTTAALLSLNGWLASGQPSKGFPDTPSRIPEDGHEASERSALPWIGCPGYYASAIVLT